MKTINNIINYIKTNWDAILFTLVLFIGFIIGGSCTPGY